MHPNDVRYGASDPTTPEWVLIENTREATELQQQNFYANIAASMEFGRRISHASHAGSLAVEEAKAARQRGIDTATADKTRNMANAAAGCYWVLPLPLGEGWGEGCYSLDPQYDSAHKQHAEDTAKAHYDYTLKSEDEKLLFQQRETNS